MTSDDLRLVDIAWRLDRLRWVPRDVLAEIVWQDGACVRAHPECDPPTWLNDECADRTLAARLCAGCPVQDACLELELRLAGDQPTGVWGALSDDDRRALHPHWLRRGDRIDGTPE